MTSSLESRDYADALDRPVKSDRKKHGVDASPDAIGGHYGVGWYEIFQDRKTGEQYQVHCSDGVNGGKGAYSHQDEAWRQTCYATIISRTRAEAKAGAETIKLSTNEWAIMLGHTHALWLDTKEGEEYGEGDRSKDEGLIGHLKGTPVIVNPDKKDELVSRQ